MNPTSSEKIIYFYHGLVDQNVYLLPRVISSLLRIPLFKNLLFIFPGIDRAFPKGRDKESQISVEIVPSSMGVFKSNWEIKQKVLERLKQVNVNYVSFHAPFVNDGAVNQKGHQSYLDNIFDLTEDTSLNLFCLVSHFQVMDYLSPGKKDKVLVVHPLPGSANKTEAEIIKSSAKLLKKVIPLARDLNISIGIENMPWLKRKHEKYTRFLGSISFFTNLMHEINDPSVGITFDWGHANSYARYMYNQHFADEKINFTAEYLEHFGYQKKFLKALKDKIFHLHLHYNSAHLVNAKAPFFVKNFDYHGDLTELTEKEYNDFKEALAIVKDSPVLKSMVLEIVPSFFSQKSRIGKYHSSVEVLRSMVE